MLCDVLHKVAKLQGSLQSKNLDLTAIPMLVQGTVERLMEIKYNVSSTTWFKDHTAVFTDPGTRNITVTETEQDNFLRNIYRPYLQSVGDHICGGLRSSDIVSSNSPDSEDSLSLFLWFRQNFSTN